MINPDRVGKLVFRNIENNVISFNPRKLSELINTRVNGRIQNAPIFKDNSSSGFWNIFTAINGVNKKNIIENMDDTKNTSHTIFLNVGKICSFVFFATALEINRSK